MCEELTSSTDSGPEALADWKAALRNDFEKWLGTIEELPEPESSTALPDLYAFYEQLALANVETRKANRRTAEAFSQWGETLSRFESQLTPLRESMVQLASVERKEQGLPRNYCVILIELLDRLARLRNAFDVAPAKRSWWMSNDIAWRKAWETQKQAFTIFVSHFEELLRKERVTRLEVLGQPFNPALMTAVATHDDPNHPPQVVLEEVVPGYARDGELLRAAQVKVNARG